MATRTIVVMGGDQTGQELLNEALRVLDPAVTQVEVTFRHFDLSLEHRRATGNAVVHEAAAALREAGLGLKAATITPETSGDVGSPNAIIRDEVDGSVILRTGRRIPGIRPVGGVFAPITVVRMAVDDAYGAQEWRETRDGEEFAFRTEKISRRICCQVAEVAFQQARRMGGKVFGGPKYTVSPVYEGMLKEEMDDAAKRYPDVRYSPQLIDATYALLLTAGDEPLVIPALNRDGDCLSDLVIQMFGSIAGAESLLLALGPNMETNVVMAEAPHGTAPGLFGKNVANPLAMILAGGAVLGHIDSPAAALASRAIAESCMEAIYDGVRTADLGGHAHTSEFTDAVIKRVQTKLAVWPSLR
ncbi:MAG TPA: isocitrate/isopropylmalate family dehydrogenase [Chloroflexaceae bacterium]|nr:isocitrate/isopropylmalate family dehydrogenase [Chloroflexaceae bacterium]